MSFIDLQSSSWYRAVNLHERVRSVASTGASPRSSVDSDPEIASNRYDRWRQQHPFEILDRFQDRLLSDGLSEPEFRFFLGEREDSVRRRFHEAPGWLQSLADAFEEFGSHNGPYPFDLTGKSSLLYLAAPLIHRSRRELRERAQQLAQQYVDLPFDADNVEGLFVSGLTERFAWTLVRTMILELDIARRTGSLKGVTPEDRYRSYIEQLHCTETLAGVMEIYPVLARNLTTRIGFWTQSKFELLDRLASDWNMIRRTFSPESEPGALVEIRQDLGDPHREGRSVHALRFASGLQIIYKPRPISIEYHFQDLLRWLNEKGLSPNLRPLAMVDGGSYGWVEYVECGGCFCADEISRFFARQGSYLAILHALGANDIHFENMIASGEHPVLIDLETVISPGLSDQAANPYLRLSHSIMSDSVLAVGLLPSPIGRNLDVSGMGGHDGQLTSREIPHMEGLGTDELHLARRKIVMPTSNNRPSLKGMDVSPCEYVNEVVCGFERTYRLLIDNRAELLAEGGPILGFSTDQVRIVLRPTQTYALLLQESYHPHLLGNGLERDRHFDRLWIDADRLPPIRQVIPMEINALAQGDIPLFSTRLDSRRLDCDAGYTIEEFFSQSGIERVCNRIEGLNKDDIVRQSQIIRSSLSIYEIETTGMLAVPSGVDLPADTVSLTEIMDLALSVGEEVVRTAFYGKEEHEGVVPASWFQPVTLDDAWVLDPLEHGLYDGAIGICLFLAHLGEVSGKEPFIGLARSALATHEIVARKSASDAPALGGFAGVGGDIYAYVQLSQLWDEPDLLLRAQDLLTNLPEMIWRDEALDFASGVAGLLISLLSLHRHSPGSFALDLAIQCGDRLARTAQTMEQGVGWRTVGNRETPLAGFAHGVAGIAYALSALAAETNDRRFQVLAEQGREYEQTLFVEEIQNWKDLRPRRNGKFLWAWCYGAPGVGLGRLGMLRHSDNPRLLDDALCALRSTLNAPWGLSHSLCHGDLGNLDLLLVARDTLGNTLGSEFTDEIEQRIGRTIRDIQNRGSIPGTVNEIHSTGLMTGLAGIGYGLLRLIAPGRVPSILLLDDLRDLFYASHPTEVTGSMGELRHEYKNSRKPQ